MDGMLLDDMSDILLDTCTYQLIIFGIGLFGVARFFVTLLLGEQGSCGRGGTLSLTHGRFRLGKQLSL